MSDEPTVRRDRAASNDAPGEDDGTEGTGCKSGSAPNDAPGVYTLSEELAIGAAIPLPLDFLPCDIVGCDRMATLLIPGAAVCRECWEEHLDDDDRYWFGAEDLVGDERWRDARRAEYAERVALMGPRRRDSERDAILDERVKRRIDLLLEVEAALADGRLSESDLP